MKKNILEAVKNGLIGGSLSGLVSAFLNYDIFPFPQSILSNVIGHSVGGFFCGFMSAFIGVLIYIHQHQQKHLSSKLKGGADHELV